MHTPALTDTSPDRMNVRRYLWNMALRGSKPEKSSGETRITYAEDLPSSPYINMIWSGQADTTRTLTFAADIFWFLRILRREGKISVAVWGPTTETMSYTYREGDEFAGVRFKAGIYMPHLPTSKFVGGEMVLPEATGKTFWLNGSAWEVPTFENIDVFVALLMREGLLACDSVVTESLQGNPQKLTSRMVQYRFLRTTGFTRTMIEQIERARYAAALLEQGKSIFETIYEAGYFDQPHLTRSLRRFTGRTPAQILHQSKP